MKFLVVDDSPVDRHFVTAMLQKMGHEVDAFNNTNNLIEKISQGNYTAVILDIVMPNLDGFKFLRQLRLNPQTAEQYVIFYSSKKTSIEINYGINRAGANDYITKPLTQKVLEEALQKV